MEFPDPPLRGTRLPTPLPYPTRAGTLMVRHYAAPSAKRVLVLAHGSGYHSAYLETIAASLADAGLADVYTPDLRGHGRSPARRGDVDYTGQLEDDLVDLIGFANARHPGARLVVGGHSSGGGLALRLAGSGKAPAVAGWLLLAPYLRHDAPTVRPGAAGWAQPLTGRIIALSVLAGFGVHALEGATAIRFHMPAAARDGTETLAYSFRMLASINPHDDYGADVAALGAPTFVAVGAADEMFFPERFTPVFAGAKARVVVTPGAAHIGLVHDQDLIAAAAAWLAER